jgi:hypothetical protein
MVEGSMARDDEIGRMFQQKPPHGSAYQEFPSCGRQLDASRAVRKIKTRYPHQPFQTQHLWVDNGRVVEGPRGIFGQSIYQLDLDSVAIAALECLGNSVGCAAVAASRIGEQKEQSLSSVRCLVHPVLP